MDPLVILALIIAAVAFLLHNSKQTAADSSAHRNNMGCATSSSSSQPSGDRRPIRAPNAAIENNYHSLAEVESALRRAGLESSDLILAIDFTKSNTWQGERSFRGQSLHALSHLELNPYQQVISTFADVLLKKLDDDCVVPLYGFGDSITSNKNVFLIHDQPCRSKEELLASYADAASSVTLSGPTSFAPIIYEAIDICKQTGKFQILVIVADGLMDDVNETIAAIVAASEHPLAIIMVGVGDGPWDSMERFDDEIPERRFDNFQFLSFTKLLHSHPDPQQRACRFALDALMELPEQYAIIKRMGLLSRAANPHQQFSRRLVGKHRIRKSSPVRVSDVQLEGQPGGASSSDGHYAHTNAPGGLNPPPYAPSKRR